MRKLNDLPFSEGDTTEALNATKLEKKIENKIYVKVILEA